MLSPLPLLIKRSAYQVWPTTVALSTPPGFLVHFCRNTTTCPTEKSNDWGTLSPAVLGKRSYQQPSTMLRSWTYNWQAFLVEAKPGNHSGWYTQPQWQWSSIDGYSKVIGLKGGGWYLEVCATGMLWLDHRTPCLSHLSAWKSSVQPKPRHGHLNRTSCCFEIAVSANQTTPGNFWQKRKLWDLSKIAFQTPIFHSWIADELKIQQNYDQDKTLAASENRTAGCRPCLVTTCCFCPGIHASGNTSSPHQFRLNPSKQPQSLYSLEAVTKKTFGQQVYPTCQPFSWKLAILATSAKEIHVPEAQSNNHKSSFIWAT